MYNVTNDGKAFTSCNCKETAIYLANRFQGCVFITFSAENLIIYNHLDNN